MFAKNEGCIIKSPEVIPIYMSEWKLGCVIGADFDSSVELAMIVRQRK
jgi:hypothetical protein